MGGITGAAERSLERICLEQPATFEIHSASGAVGNYARARAQKTEPILIGPERYSLAGELLHFARRSVAG